MMDDDLIVVSDADINVQEIMRQIRANIARRKGDAAEQLEVNPVTVSEELWEDTIGEAARFQEQVGRVGLTRYDCDIVPRNYKIEWIHPILGPVHAVVRRIINAEIRRYLDASLSKQTFFNENVLQALQSLVAENLSLQQELQELRSARDSDQSA
jgi:hypothetical protein